VTPFLIVAALLILAAGVTYLARKRTGGGGLEGVHGFRRHMDALSSEARRDVIGRLQSPEPPDERRQQTQRIAGQPGVGGRMDGHTNDSVGGGPFDDADTAEEDGHRPHQQPVEHEDSGEGTEAKG
jgi:hypothetical protein